MNGVMSLIGTSATWGDGAMRSARCGNPDIAEIAEGPSLTPKLTLRPAAHSITSGEREQQPGCLGQQPSWG
jgi:hypothetical protein